MRNNTLRWLLFALLVSAMALALGHRDQLDVAALREWADRAGVAAPVLFVAIYALGTLLFLPGSVITLAGGAIFGPILGTFYNLVGATLGALLAFLVARFLAADWVERKTGGRLKRLKEGVEKEGWRFVAFVRLVPLFPFNLLNYALGLTRIPPSQYLIATSVFIIPGTIAYTYLGYLGGEAAAGGEGLVQKGLLALSLLAVVAFLPRLVARLRQGATLSIDELRARLGRPGAPLVLDLRSPADYQGELGHIPGSINIPLEELEARLPELAPSLEKPLALICTTDRRSRKAARILAREGFGNVHVVLGGMTRWNRQSLSWQGGTPSAGGSMG